MSVNVVTGLAEAYTALTGLETVQTATGIMVNNGGSWTSADASTIYNVIKNGGCKAVGQVSHLNPNAWQVVDYAAKTGEFVYEGSKAITSEYMWSVPEQYAGNALVRSQTISNAGRAALQNGGAQIGTKVLQPVTNIEVVQSTGGASVLQTTSKGVLTKIPLKAAMRACAAAQGIMLGVEFVESNPELATRLSNAIFRTDIDPANIASIVENTTVWANIRDGAIFLTEDFINCVKNVFMDIGVFADSGADISKSAGVTGRAFGVVGAGFYWQANNQLFKSCTQRRCFWESPQLNSSNSVVVFSVRPTTSQVVFSNPAKTRGSISGTAGQLLVHIYSKVAFGARYYNYNMQSGTAGPVLSNNAENYGSWDNTPYPNLPDISGNNPTPTSYESSRSISTQYGTVYTINSNILLPFDDQYNIDILTDLPLIEAPYGQDGISAAKFLYDTYPEYNPPSGDIAGTKHIPGAVFPTSGGTTATDYPDWWNKRVETLEGNNDTGEIVPVPWLPVNIFQPTGDDPGDYDQNSSQDGEVNDDDKITEIINTFDDSLEDNEQDPDPDPDPDIYPNPNPAPDPTLVTPVTPIPPVEDPSDGVSPDPTNPIITTAATSGLAHIYNPTLSEVQAVSRKLWTLDFIENLKKIFVDPMDGIIGFLIIYATPKTTNPEDIVLGVYNTNVPAKVVTNQYITIDCGTVTVNEFFKDARDYAPYTSVSLYLPFIGVVSLYADDIINSHVNIVYHVDVLTGTCLATVKVIKQGASAVIYQYPGNCAVQIPLTSMNYSSIVTSLFSVGISAVGGAALGTAKAVGRRAAGALYGAARSAAINASTSQIEVQQSGSIGSNAGVMGIRTPYFVIRRPVINDAYGYSQQYGYPSNKWVVLGSMKGFTRIKSIHLDSIVCTDEEKEMLDSLLKEGVVF